MTIPNEDHRARLEAERDRRNEETRRMLAVINSPEYSEILEKCKGCKLFVPETSNCQYFATRCSCGGAHNIARGIVRKWPCKQGRWEIPLDDSPESTIHLQPVVQTGPIR